MTLAWWYAATKTPYFAGCCGAPGIMTDAVGAKNAFDDNKQYWPEIGWESVLDRDPTVLVLADLDRGGDGDSAADKIAFLESDPVASKLTAVKNKRYIILEGTTMDPSIRNVGGIEQLSDGCASWVWSRCPRRSVNWCVGGTTSRRHTSPTVRSAST